MLMISSLSYILNGQINLAYQLPHDDILNLADVSPAPLISINTHATKAILLKRSMYKSIDELSKEEIRLGGLRIDPENLMNSRIRYMKGISVLDINSGEENSVSGLPGTMKIVKMSWSPDQKR